MRVKIGQIELCQRLAEGMTVIEITESYGMTCKAIWDKLARMRKKYAARTTYQLLVILATEHQIESR